MSWSWYSGPVLKDHRCSHCQKLLRYGHQSVGLVVWTDEQVYALECLLDKLATPAAGRVEIDGYTDAGVPFKIF